MCYREPNEFGVGKSQLRGNATLSSDSMGTRSNCSRPLDTARAAENVRIRINAMATYRPQAVFTFGDSRFTARFRGPRAPRSEAAE